MSNNLHNVTLEKENNPGTVEKQSDRLAYLNEINFNKLSLFLD